ncbi:DNA circularization N-terminal domain-containing protein [Roseomonas sp. F4]
MSGFLGLGIESALGLTTSRFRAASFRGVGFKVVEQAGDGGRSLGIHLLPLRDQHVVEDMGGQLPRFSVTGYVIGGDYVAERDAIIKACTEGDTPGTLVLPTLPSRRAWCEAIRYSENMKEGGFCTLQMTFVAEPPPKAKVAPLDGLRQTLRQVGAVLAVARRGYALYRAANGDLGSFLSAAAGSFASGLASSLAEEWLGLSGLNLAPLRTALADLSAADGEDADLTAAAVTAPFLALAEAPVTAVDPTIPEGQGVAQVVARSRPEAPDPGLLATLLLAQAATPARPDGADVQAIADLARDAAAVAAAQATAEANWASASQVLAARDALLLVLAARANAAADRGDDALAAGFRALAAGAQQDLVARAARLPQRAPYALPGSLPVLALAQRLHADGARADELLAQNVARHPAFMPREGWRLRP